MNGTRVPSGFVFSCALLAVAWLSVFASPLHAAGDDLESFLLLDIDELVQVPVVTASRHRQAYWQAPAVITVLEGEDIRRAGYRSLAEALAQVPGLHLVQDGVGTYAVVRGIGSGQRAYARTLKVMLDGQPLGMRSDAGQFLGPELVPLSLVGRVEIVRGPASALYGADAYLGVINIITRRQAPPLRLQAGIGQVQDADDASVSLDTLLSGDAGNWQWLLASAGAQEDHSGSDLPRSSPSYSRFPDTTSRGDDSRPANFYARLLDDEGRFSQQWALHATEVDRDAEFLDFGALSHANRVALRQQTANWQGEWTQADGRRYLFRVAHATGGPADAERLSLGLPGSHPQREFGYAAWDLGVEGQFASGPHHVVLGLDGNWDREEPFEVYSVNDLSGMRTQLSPAQPERLFRNLGAVAQYQWQPVDAAWALSLNWRHDSHNRYGEHDSYRFGFNAAFSRTLYGKLLYGTAFKAPNAFQLYAQPLYTGDILGNASLTPERARTLEAQLEWEARPGLGLGLTVYGMEVRDLIELQPTGVNQRWSNRGEQDGSGIESTLRWRHGHHLLTATSAWQDTRVRLQQPLLPVVEVATASAPRWLGQVGWRHALPDRQVGIDGRFVSPRRASDSNIDVNLRQAYTLPGYAIWRLHAFRGFGAHRLGVTLDNLLDEEYAEPGYGGVDLPGQPRTLWLNWSWQASPGVLP